MPKLSLFLLLFLNLSCASTGAEYVPITVSSEEEMWEFCSKELHGEEVDRKGMCFLEEQCKKGVFQSREGLVEDYYKGKIPPERCRRVLKMCEWGNTLCMDQNKLWDKVIVSP